MAAPGARPPIVLLPPAPPSGLAPDAAAALALGARLDAVDAAAAVTGAPAFVRVVIEDPAAASLVAALLPPGVAVLSTPPVGSDAELLRLEAAPAADLAAVLDRAGAPSPAPRTWHLAHRLPELAHSA
ncbi:MAG: hypothetical protein QOD86_589 [Miltoncostaeaceae bacterium]|nr:hypothetical protein [Miltoncostaeaceae bacterium]